MDYELTNKQQNAFDRLEKAYIICIESGIYFYNNYGSLGAIDSNKYCGYDDDSKGIEDTQGVTEQTGGRQRGLGGQKIVSERSPSGLCGTSG